MIDLKNIIDQVQEFQLILHDIYIEKIVPSEYFLGTTIIKKLPSFYKC
jgi:hypothetical protein